MPTRREGAGRSFAEAPIVRDPEGPEAGAMKLGRPPKAQPPVSNVPVTLYLDTELDLEIRAQAARLDRRQAEIIRWAWKIARGRVRALPRECAPEKT